MQCFFFSKKFFSRLLHLYVIWTKIAAYRVSEVFIMSTADNASNKGYLKENFRLFTIKDKRQLNVESHYHEFDKVLIFFSGNVEYTVEGTSYRPQNGDILFVRHHDIHKLSVSDSSTYDRCVLWIRSGYLKEYSRADVELENCFELAKERHAYLYHPNAESWARIKRSISDLKAAEQSDEYGAQMISVTCFLQLMVELNRCVMSVSPKSSLNSDELIDNVMRYISENLNTELSVDMLASMCYLSRFYFMRRFKEYTGYTVHGYIQLKRLTLASELLCQGMTVSEAASAAGFMEYSSFLRAFRKLYGLSPRDYVRRSWQTLDCSYDE